MSEYGLNLSVCAWRLKIMIQIFMTKTMSDVIAESTGLVNGPQLSRNLHFFSFLLKKSLVDMTSKLRWGHFS